MPRQINDVDQTIVKWLYDYFPSYIEPEDVEEYSRKLVTDGFSSTEWLDNHLTPGDLIL